MIVNVDDLIKELEKYPRDMEVFYATKYALTPLEVVKLNDNYLCIDMDSSEKHKYENGE